MQFARLEDARNALNLNGQLEIVGRAIKVLLLQYIYIYIFVYVHACTCATIGAVLPCTFTNMVSVFPFLSYNA